MGSVTKPFLAVLGGQTIGPPPLWMMRQAGRYLPEYRKLRQRAPSFLDFCYTPELAVEATLQPLRRFGFDAAILFSDILVVPDALGQPVAFREGEGPVLEPVRSTAAIRRLDPGRLLGHLEPVFRAIGGIRQALPERTALIGFAGAPWTVATYMVEGRGGSDFAQVLRWDAEDRGGFGGLIGLLVEATAAYLIEQVRHGAEALQLFDTWAGVLDDERFGRLVVEPTRAVVGRVREVFADVPILGFPKGAGRRYPDYVRRTGVSAVGLDAETDLDFARRDIQPLAAVQGNLDPQVVVRGGMEMDRTARHILDILGAGPFIFNLGHGIVPETPVEHVAELARIVRGWRPH